MNNIITMTYPPPKTNINEILRYAGGGDAETINIINECMSEAENHFTYKVCYTQLPVKISENVCNFGNFSIKSQHLAKNLEGCEYAIIFAATIGVYIDRLITKYSHISPSKALIMQAIGAERIEALCDEFCCNIKKKLKFELKPRFSAGYGDLSIDTQKQIFSLLNCQKNIGLFLNNSMLMSPTKSVTAFIGIKK